MQLRKANCPYTGIRTDRLMENPTVSRNKQLRLYFAPPPPPTPPPTQPSPILLTLVSEVLEFIFQSHQGRIVILLKEYFFLVSMFPKSSIYYNKDKQDAK